MVSSAAVALGLVLIHWLPPRAATMTSVGNPPRDAATVCRWTSCGSFDVGDILEPVIPHGNCTNIRKGLPANGSWQYGDIDDPGTCCVDPRTEVLVFGCDGNPHNLFLCGFWVHVPMGWKYGANMWRKVTTEFKPSPPFPHPEVGLVMASPSLYFDVRPPGATDGDRCPDGYDPGFWRILGQNWTYNAAVDVITDHDSRPLNLSRWVMTQNSNADPMQRPIKPFPTQNFNTTLGELMALCGNLSDTTG